MENRIKEVRRFDGSDTITAKNLLKLNKSYYLSSKSSFEGNKRSF